MRVDFEGIFECSEVVGKVFDDVNQNGYQDQGEKGMPGVRLATVRGILITTDKHGRYSVPCADVPAKDIGSNFLLKLDTRTLPTGYRLTTENPRVVRLTKGKMTKLNFGVAIDRVVRIDLNDSAFVAGGDAPSAKLEAGVDMLVASLMKERSILRLTYYLAGESEELAKRRLSAIDSLVRRRWAQAQGSYELGVESKIVRK